MHSAANSQRSTPRTAQINSDLGWPGLFSHDYIFAERLSYQGHRCQRAATKRMFTDAVPGYRGRSLALAATISNSSTFKVGLDRTDVKVTYLVLA